MAYRSDIFNGGFTKDTKVRQILRSNNIYDRSEIEWYNKFNRFGCLDPYNGLIDAKEYLFFTKPDLHIVEPGTFNLNPELYNNPFFVELIERYPMVIDQLQSSSNMYGDDSSYPFINLLSNSVKSNMDLPGITANMSDNNQTQYGTSITYRQDGFSSDENHDFDLQFEDTKYLELYHFFKAFEEYERLKNVGRITPPNIDNAPIDEQTGYAYSYYIRNQILHDAFAIYKIIVDEDYEDILYYAVAQGVTIKTVPRESFSNLSGDDGLKYSVSFHAEFVYDMEPWILENLNNCTIPILGESSNPVYVDIYNDSIGRVDGSWVKSPYIVKSVNNGSPIWLGPSGMKYKYKLKWRDA